MPEVALAGEDHRDAVFVGRGDDLFVADRTLGLNDGGVILVTLHSDRIQVAAMPETDNHQIYNVSIDERPKIVITELTGTFFHLSYGYDLDERRSVRHYVWDLGEATLSLPADDSRHVYLPFTAKVGEQ